MNGLKIVTNLALALALGVGMQAHAAPTFGGSAKTVSRIQTVGAGKSSSGLSIGNIAEEALRISKQRPLKVSTPLDLSRSISGALDRRLEKRLMERLRFEAI